IALSTPSSRHFEIPVTGIRRAMTKEQIRAFGGRKRFRPFIIVFKSGQHVKVSNRHQMFFAPHPDEAVIYYQGSWRVLALSRIDHLELIPVAERLRRLLSD